MSTNTRNTRRRKKKKNKVILFAVEIIVLVALLIGLLVYFKLNKVESGIGDICLLYTSRCV